MSDYAKGLLQAIETGDQESMNASFNDALNAKIADAIDAKRIEVAQSLYGGEVDNSEYESNDDLETSDDDTEEV
jgi:hypothetical protein